MGLAQENTAPRDNEWSNGGQCQTFESEDVSPNYSFSEIDRHFQILISSLTAGISPVSIALAYSDWLAHLSISTGLLSKLWFEAWQKAVCFQEYELIADQAQSHPFESPAPGDHRFSDESWKKYPFNIYQQGFLAFQNWLQDSVTHVRGVSQHHSEVVAFINRQLIDAVSPSNFIATNPAVLKRTMESGGENLWLGFSHLVDDLQHALAGELPEHLQPFKVGVDLAVTPGKVVYRNEIMELIQYETTTRQVYAEPVLIMPAWIMKYYILDLTPGKSLVEYLLAEGHSVFMISWKNPSRGDKNTGIENYLKRGLIQALDVIGNIIPEYKIHATGYCLGGTLLALGTAWLSRINDKRLKTISLLAAQTDFDDAGELLLFY